MSLRTVVASGGAGALALAWAFGACADRASDARPDAATGGADAADVLVWGGSGGLSGGGGSGGTSGGGAAGAGGDPGLPPAHAWLADPNIWSPVPGTEFTHPYCKVFEAAGDKLAFPTLDWQGCGDGCSVADLVQGLGEGAWYGVGSTHRVQGETRAFLTIEQVAKGTDVYSVRRVLDVASGASNAAVQLRISDVKKTSCGFGNGRESARANAFFGGEPSHEIWAIAPYDAAPWVWSQPGKPQSSLPAGLVQFDVDSNAAVFKTGKGGVWALLDPKKNEWTTLEAPSSSHNGSGEGDLAAWTDYPTSTSERLRGWAPDGKGVRTLLDPVPFETCTVALTSTTIVGHAMAGNGGCEGSSGAPKSWFWTAPRAYSASAVKPVEGPPFPGSFFSRTGSFIRAWGDHAAVQLGELSGPGVVTNVSIFVMRLSTQKLWRVDPRPGFALHSDGWTLTETHLYLAEKEASNTDPWLSKRVVRLDLAKLDTLGQPLN
ncbi:MAG: hypothetical protein IPM35_22395 [Myxococcales bacterium]|nr:hypothetical protein [Myxococcales bacterium]